MEKYLRQQIFKGRQATKLNWERNEKGRKADGFNHSQVLKKKKW